MVKFDEDFKRYDLTGKKWYQKSCSVLHNNNLLAMWYERKLCSTQNKIVKRFCSWRSKRLFAKSNNEISLKNIDGGLCLNHACNITINSRAHIGKDFTIFKGATVGSIRSGSKNGTPTIGDRVTVCTNAFVCGNITIGDDVLIASNAFVNFDVPSNSVVIGNPGVIHHKENPSADYLPKNK